MLDGYWLPQDLRRRVLTAGAPSASATMLHGRSAEPAAAGSVTAAWPQLDRDQWAVLLDGLAEARRRLPAGPALWERLQAALARLAARLSGSSGPGPDAAWLGPVLDLLAVYTGYSPEMIRAALRAMDLMALDQMPQAMALEPAARDVGTWQPLPGLPGRWRFQAGDGLPGRLSRLLQPGRGLYGPARAPELVVGYAAGNVPGAALLITFLGLAASLAGEAAPAVLVKNSRHEPIFAPLLLAGLEAEDPELVSAVAVLIWDYEDAALQRLILGRAGLVLAAASDETIGRIRQDVAAAARPGAAARFHAHGHKVSFSLIGREALAEDAGAAGLLDVVTTLSALDSAFWDQHGCLSSRIHFVEEGGAGSHAAEAYAAGLAAQLRRLAAVLPRGAWPLHPLHDRFDRYKTLEAGGRVKVLSGYDEPFVVVLDARPQARSAQAAAALRSAVNECQGRTVIVRPVADLAEVPERTLPLLPRENLQSLSVAVGRPGEGLSARFLEIAAACSRCGVTAIRTAGRGAFPQLAYSWDGLLPPDIVRSRPPGWFTTIEFDAPREQMLATYEALGRGG